MQIVKTIAEMKQLRQKLAEPVGLVPTMGALHEGHLALVKRSKAECRATITYIFVNPAQFLPSEDLKAYPRVPDQDTLMLEAVGNDVLFMPPEKEVYPPDFNTWVEVKGVTERLEGAARPGHFRGVATVLTKFFNIVEPMKAYFGQKDAQQVIVVKKMVADLNMNMEIVVVPTVREPDGLAMSSRNVFLNPQERRAATVLYQSLRLAQDLFSKGEKDAERIRKAMEALIRKEPLAAIDYVSIAHPETLEELETVKSGALASLAVKIGKIRLIDNLLMK